MRSDWGLEEVVGMENFLEHCLGKYVSWILLAGVFYASGTWGVQGRYWVVVGLEEGKVGEEGSWVLAIKRAS